MKLRVVAAHSVVAGHKQRLPGEVFDVTDQMGRSLLAALPDALQPAGGQVVVRAAEVVADLVEAAPLPVAELGLSSRVIDALQANGIETAEELAAAVAAGEEAMLAMSGIGPRALDEIRVALETAA